MARRRNSVSLGGMSFLRPLVLIVAGLVACSSPAASPPTPYGPLPTERQLQWHALEAYGFVHFTVNTFTDREWGLGDESPAVFNPTAFDADQIARTAKEGGLRGLILTAKHHDGFCLWPSKFTEHSVKNSPWKNGRGDVVREMADACRRAGIAFGVYLSPWDRNHRGYGRPEYLTYFRNQLRELLTNYGPLFTVWFDGANGGDGYYGGANEKRSIDNRTYYDWANTWAIVRELQPMAAMFSDAGPDFRWVGNERGIAGETCWATLDMTKPMRYPGGGSVGLNAGERPGTQWLPAECDVSIRPGWFYHAGEDVAVKTPAQLLDIYYKSVGRGAALNLNLPPDRRGLIHENDVKSLREFRRLLDLTFAKNLAAGATLTASNTRGGGDKTFAAARVLDGRRDTYWATEDAVTTPELVVELPQTTTFNVVDLRECLPLGQRIEAFAVDAWRNGKWEEFAAGTSIGSRRLVRGASVTTQKVRLRITQAAVAPALAEFGLYAEPVLLDAPTITRDRQGAVTIQASTAAAVVRYTTDRSEPMEASPVFTAPIALAKGGTIRARAFYGEGAKPGELASRSFGVSKARWKVVAPTAAGRVKETPRLMIDDAPASVWRAERAEPMVVVLDLGEALTIAAVSYLPPAGGARGVVDRYEWATSADGKMWTTADIGEFANIRANPIEQTVAFAAPATGRYLRFTALHALDDSPPAVAELGVTAK